MSLLRRRDGLRRKNAGVPRSLVTVDLGAIRHNAGVLTRRLEETELWAVVKADGYGHGAADVARAALEGGATALCVATVGEGSRCARPGADVRILVLGPTDEAAVAAAALHRSS